MAVQSCVRVVQNSCPVSGLGTRDSGLGTRDSGSDRPQGLGIRDSGCSREFFTTGNGGWRPPPNIASCVPSSGGWTGSTVFGVGVEPEVERLAAWASQTVSNSDAFFALPPCRRYTLEGDRLSFPSAVRTPHEENNTVRARFFRTRRSAGGGGRRSCCRSGTRIPKGTWACAGC